MHFALFYSLLALEYATLARASLYFLQPARGSSCTGGSPCTVRWLDDGNAPLLNAVGVVTAALYTGKMQLVQTLQPVDTANVLSYQFTPIPEAGPNSENYYVAFTSNKAEVNGTRYIGYSPFFSLNGMTGDFDKPLAQATAVIAIPGTVSHSAGTILPATITVGSVDTSFSTPATSTSRSSSSLSSIASSSTFTSRFTTSSIPSESPSVTPAGAATTGASASSPRVSTSLLATLMLCVFFSS